MFNDEERKRPIDYRFSDDEDRENPFQPSDEPVRGAHAVHFEDSLMDQPFKQFPPVFDPIPTASGSKTKAVNALEAVTKGQCSEIPEFHANPATDKLPAREWIRKCKRSAQMLEWTETQLIIQAVDKLKKAAFQWYEAMMAVTEGKLRETFANFEYEFLKRYCCEKKGKYSGWEHLVKMSLVEKEEDIELSFTRIVCHSVRWSELLQFPRRLRKSQSIPSKFLEGWTQDFYDSLTEEECAAPYERGFMDGLKLAKDSIVAAMFYKNLPENIRSQLGNMDLPNLADLKDAAVKADTRNEPAPTVTVSAITTKPKQKRSSTGPSNDNRRNITCLYCEKKGHVQADCRKRQRENGKLKPLPQRKVNEVSEEKKDVHSYSLNY